MTGTVNAALIATWIAIGVPLATGSFIILGSIRARKVSILFSVLLMAMLLDTFALVAFVSLGLAYLELAKAALLLMAAFALIGIVVGSVRGLRSGRAIRGA